MLGEPELAMGGVATFSGTTYQERVVAYLAVHVLSQRQLQWFGTEDDTPLSVSGETGGPGDDCAVALRGLPDGIEVQAKHGLTAGAALKEAVGEIIERLRKGGPSLRVVLAVDRSRTGTVLQVGDDLRRVRSGRTDRLKAETSALFGLAADAKELLARVSIICVDVDRDDASHAKEALVHLGTVLEDPSQAAAAWQILIADAGTLSARRWSRLRDDLVGLLHKNGIRVKPMAAEEHRRLDDCRDLLRGFHVSVAKERLAAFESSLSAAARKDPEIQVRLLVLKANCEMRTGAYDSATTLARRALDVRQDDLDALRVGGFSRLYAGDIAEATAFADRAIVAARLDPKAWVFKAQVDAQAGVPPITPPEPVPRSAEYQTVLAKIARDREDWAKVLELTAELLRTGERDPDVLLLRAEALVAPGPPLASAVVRDATELCREVVEQLPNDDDPRVHRALGLRSSVLSDAGDKAGAEADQARLQDIAGGDPNMLQSAAGIRARSGDPKGAIRVLEHHSVELQPLLLAFRSQLKKDCGDDEGAKKDAASAFALLNDKTPSETKLAVAEALLLMGGKEDCLSLLADPVVANASDPTRYVLTGRIAFLEGRIEDAIQAFRSGAEPKANARRTILFELADRLKRLGRAPDAVSVLKEFEGQPLPDREFLLLAQCFFEANRLVDTQRLIETRAASAPLPPAVLSLAFDIAIRSEDRDAAIGHLRALIRGGVATLDAHLELARLLAESGRSEEAREECRSFLEIDNLPALQRVHAAYLLAHLEGSAFALDAAFRGYREARQDYRVHEGLIVISGLTKEPLTQPEAVAPDTYVRLGHDKDVREYTIFRSGPIDPTRGERTVEEATDLGLLGKRVGDTVSMAGALDPVDWKVEEILTAVQRGINEALTGYEKNFPDRTFLRSFPAPDSSSVGELSLLIRTVGERKTREDMVFRTYWQGCLPLGTVGSALGLFIPEVMARLSSRDDVPGVLAELPRPPDQRAAVEVARSSSEIVLTRSALSTLDALDLRDLVADNYSLVVPRSLLVVLDEEARQAREHAEQGRSFFGAGDTGLVAHALEPGHPSLVAHRDRLEGLRSWLLGKAKVEARPLEMVEATIERSRQTLRDRIGAESWDALELARHRDVPLYADDLGLRRLEQPGRAVRSFSTATLLVRLAEDGKLDVNRSHLRLHDLILARHLHVPVSVPLLLAAVSRMGDLRGGEVAKILGLLATLPTIGEAAATAAKTFKELATSAVQTTPLRQLARMALEAMRPGWPVGLIAQQVRQAARSEFELMPREFREIDRACGEFARS